jgi:hypothetical protein
VDKNRTKHKNRTKRSRKRDTSYQDFRRKVRERILAGGFKSVSAACRSLDIPAVSLDRLLRHGLPKNPRVNTIVALQKLGILDLVRSQAAS